MGREIQNNHRRKRALHQIRISHDKNLVRHDRCQFHVVGYENQRKAKLSLQSYNFIMIFFRSGKSNPLVASSKIRHCGSAANALAIATPLLFSTGQL